MKRSVVGAVGKALVRASSWLVPVLCAGCGEPDVAVCASCASSLGAGAEVSRSLTIDGFVLPVFTMREGTLARVLIARLKDEERLDSAPWLARALDEAIGVARASVTVEASAPPRPRTTRLVPIPTTKRAFRRRGYWPLGILLAGRSDVVAGALVSNGSLDQRGLGATARSQNMRDAFGAGADIASVIGRRVLLVDDVVTTGATVAAAARVLLDAGASVEGVVALASVALDRDDRPSRRHRDASRR